MKKPDPLVRKDRKKFWRRVLTLLVYLILLPFAIAVIIDDFVYGRRRW